MIVVTLVMMLWWHCWCHIVHFPDVAWLTSRQHLKTSHLGFYVFWAELVKILKRLKNSGKGKNRLGQILEGFGKILQAYSEKNNFFVSEVKELHLSCQCLKDSRSCLLVFWYWLWDIKGTSNCRNIFDHMCDICFMTSLSSKTHKE